MAAMPGLQGGLKDWMNYCKESVEQRIEPSHRNTVQLCEESLNGAAG